ncbi:hypothetical protein DdX_00565 [Ditylenchus destructor]|uniref:Uncharacterized protein n=1 Tax=Ditylenchus destructor TaxID=166010 RepID=A0AAD4NH88_9BILA|nr:hypothetical protein DdX_00565 [Ditylenchus destructor]
MKRKREYSNVRQDRERGRQSLIQQSLAVAANVNAREENERAAAHALNGNRFPFSEKDIDLAFFLASDMSRQLPKLMNKNNM